MDSLPFIFFQLWMFSSIWWFFLLLTSSISFASFPNYVGKRFTCLHHSVLLWYSSSTKFLSPIPLLTPSFHDFLGLPLFLLSDGTYFRACFRRLSFVIHWVCLYHSNCFSVILSSTLLSSYIISCKFHC